MGIRQEPGGVWLRGRTADGVREERFDRVVLCTGLHADHTAARAGDSPEPKVVPFRGEYYLLRPDKRDLVNGLVYPVPDPRYPFLGVHLTPRVDGEVMVGPNAVLALAREGYTWGTVSAKDPREIAAYSGFRRFARQHWRTGAVEMAGSLSKRRFVAAARRYVPEPAHRRRRRRPSGIRAQTLRPDGSDGRRLPDQHPGRRHRAAQPVPGGHVEPRDRRAPRRRDARPHLRGGCPVTGSTHLPHGLWVVLASPFDDDLALDLASLERQPTSPPRWLHRAWSRSVSSARPTHSPATSSAPSSAPSRRRTTDRSSSACPAAPPPWWSSRRGTAPRQPRVRPSR